ncbi:hypothetical protein [Paenibacillus cremeus]|uniref:Uncharacterized protein n=1 Tax=Paenibacillus cremeus TaxID=2163881 RepID=A0A559KGF7_9BACL|nr:hypothetical protein [Paenibacillus cremeus]TVY11209.1 hypothetical protein FPZ49_05080 [Paenibacillus cremeus]
MRGKAVILPDRLQVKYQDVDIPEPSEGDVVIEVKHSWISIGTESSYFRGERVNGEEPYREGRLGLTPTLAGYQKVGTVVYAGSAANGLKAGDSVFATVSRMSHMFKPRGGHINPAVTEAADQVEATWQLITDKKAACLGLLTKGNSSLDDTTSGIKNAVDPLYIVVNHQRFN